MKCCIILIVVWCCTAINSVGFHYQFELENRQFDTQSHSAVRLEMMHWLNKNNNSNYLGYYAYSELEAEVLRGHAGLAYHLSNGLQSNIGIGLSRDQSLVYGNLGLSFHGHDHLAELQVDFTDQMIVRGFYNYLVTDWLELGLYGRTHYGLGPRIIISPIEYCHIALSYTHDPEHHNSLITQLLITF